MDSEDTIAVDSVSGFAARALVRVARFAAVGLLLLTPLPPARATTASGTDGEHCSSLVLSRDSNPVFATNYDHRSVSAGLAFLNPRGLAKAGVEPGTTGRLARWSSRYASLSFNLVGYQFAWSGMNERGLAISTMSLYETECSPPDERPILDSGMWIQHALDTCATVDEVIATGLRARIVTVDHYLVADAGGEVATIEFLDGEMVVHRGAAAPVSVLTNNPYAEALSAWMDHRDSGEYGSLGTSLQRFCLAADRVSSYSSGAAVPAAFDILHEIRGERFSVHASQWSIVYDLAARRAHFLTLQFPSIKTVALSDLELRCGRPVQMLDMQLDAEGDAAPAFFDYDPELSYRHTRQFVIDWGVALPDATLRALLDWLESYPCVRQRRPGGRIRLSPRPSHGNRSSS